MSLLPQRKKSPEEIAKLREDLGMRVPQPNQDLTDWSDPPAAAPPPPPPPPPATRQPPPSQSPAVPVAEPPPPAAPTQPQPKQVHSLKRSERVPLLTPEGPKSPPPDDLPTVTLTLKPVRSLKKSEQIPLPAPHAPPPPDTNLPYHRHSDQELQQIRRREALTRHSTVANPKLVVAHTALLVFGYFTALAGASPYAAMLYLTYFPQDGAACTSETPSLFAFAPLPITIPACCVAAALFVAVFIALKKPISRHHAAFIAVITLFVSVFDILHYFPQLRHGS